MKKRYSVIRGALCLLLCLCSLTLCSCSGVNKFKTSGVSFVDKKTDVTYDYAPFCYEPIGVEEEVYGSNGEIEFHKIKGQDPLVWLADSEGTVFYSSKISLPSLDKMEISRIELCINDSQLFVRDTVEDTDETQAVIDGYLGAESIYYPNKTAKYSYKLRFADTTRGIFYCVDFIRYSEDYTLSFDSGEVNYGTDFLYNRSEDRFVKAPALITERINALVGEPAVTENE